MSELNWLIDPPEDFSALVKEWAAHEPDVVQLQKFVSYNLSANQANRLYRAYNKLDDAKKATIGAAFSSVKLGIVSNGTMDLMYSMLFIAALRHGVLLDIVGSDFDQALQEAVDPQSHLNQSNLDMVLISLDYRGYRFAYNTYSVNKEGFDAEEAHSYLTQIVEGFRQHSGVNSIVQTLAKPPVSLLGSLDKSLPQTLANTIDEFNRKIVKTCSESSSYLFDVGAIAADFGNQRWFDERQWLLSRIPFSHDALPVYGERLGALLGAIRGKSKKCLVLDLDNTVWGGVIGDDGMDGIVVGEGNPVGEAHLSLQRYALELKEHGIVLAVCSKNDEKNAIEPFRDHPDMLLKEQDIAVFVANWNDKASNLKYIAQTLNIGIDALVFVDDNPAEREIIRQMLPSVGVPELPNDPALYTRTVCQANYFEAVTFNQEDKLRAEQYRQNSQRQALLSSSEGIEDYLNSLEMKGSVKPFDKLGRKRITQLINKTNQFNLTTKRYTEEQVEQFEHSKDHVTMQIRLRDRFGDNGMISVVIGEVHGDALEIDSWLMSCRVIKRDLEKLVCDQLVEAAKSLNLANVKGTYIPTAKNQLVENHYRELGFDLVEQKGDETYWTLDVNDYEFKRPPIELE